MARKLLSLSLQLDTDRPGSFFGKMNSPDDTLSRTTHELQNAVSAHDRGLVAQLLPSLHQSLIVSPQQRHVPLTKGLQLLHLGAQALDLATGNVQVFQFVCCPKEFLSGTRS